MDFIFILELILFVVLMGFSAFFSSSETALFSLDSLQLEQMRRDKNPNFDLINDMLSRPRRLIMTILIGNELVNVSASVISASMIITLLGAESKWMNLLIMVPILLLVGEITPKTLAIRNNIAFANAECRPIDLFARLIKPIRLVVRLVADRIITLIVGKERSRGNIITEDMVRTLAREAVGEGALDAGEAQLIDHIFDFRDKTVADVMTPRSDISFLSADMQLSKALKIQQKTQHSKMPVYQDDRDEIIGILYIRDLLGINIKKLSKDRSALKRILRQAYFVPETKPAVELFETLRQRKLSIALTVDEYGGITGLVTMEDLLECIFGDIRSPSDLTTDQHIRKLTDDSYEVDGACELIHFDELMGSHFSANKADTVGGLILNEYGELPLENTSIELDEFRFKVIDVKNHRIKLINAERITQPEPQFDPQPEPKQNTKKKKSKNKANKKNAAQSTEQAEIEQESMD